MGSGSPQLADCSRRKPLPLSHDIELHVIKRHAYGYVLFFLFKLTDAYKAGTFRGTVSVVHRICGKIESDQFFTCNGKSLKAVILHVDGKLTAHLGRHEHVGHMILLHIFVHGCQVKPSVISDDHFRSTRDQRRICVHHMHVKTVACICADRAFTIKRVIPYAPLDEAHDVAVSKPHPFGHSGRA